MASIQLPASLNSPQRELLSQPSPLTYELSENVSLRPPEYGTWKCCQCQNDNHLHVRPGKHPVGAVACKCPHKPCEDCEFTGTLKYFLPISEPLPIPSELGENVPYGIICGDCGLSWQSKEVRPPRQLKKIPSVSFKNDAHKHQQSFYARRLPPEYGRLRKAQSMMNLRQMMLSKAMEREEREEQAQSTCIQFSGLRCTCGSLSSLDSFCFRITEHSTDILEPAPVSPKPVAPTVPQYPSRATNSHLLAMGHDAPIIRIRGIEHPNPLRGNPVSSAVPAVGDQQNVADG